MRLYVWLDRYDREMVSLGDTARNGFVCWGQMHLDGVGEVFGRDVKQAIIDADGDPVELKGDVDICPVERPGFRR